MYEILERDFESFFRVPFEVRGEKSFYAAPFKPDLKKMLSVKNPIFRSENDFTFYTITENGKPVGRITAHLHHAYNVRYHTQACYFGFFECVNDFKISRQLFQLAEAWAKSKNCTLLTGNFNLTAMQEMGVMIDGFDHEPYILQSYGMPYYSQLMTDAGFSPTFPMSTYEVDLQTINPESVRTEKHKALLEHPDFEFVPVTRAMYPKLRPIILDIFNKGFDQNPLFVPITQEEFDFQAKDLVYFMDSSISFLAKHKGQPVGVSIHVPDINPLLRDTKSKLGLSMLYHFIKLKLKRERTLCIFAAMLPEYQKQGVLGAIIYLTLRAMKKRGYKKFGITWISDKNGGSLKKMEDMNAKKIHDLRIFEKQLL